MRRAQGAELGYKRAVGKVWKMTGDVSGNTCNGAKTGGRTRISLGAVALLLLLLSFLFVAVGRGLREAGSGETFISRIFLVCSFQRQKVTAGRLTIVKK